MQLEGTALTRVRKRFSMGFSDNRDCPAQDFGAGRTTTEAETMARSCTLKGKLFSFQAWNLSPVTKPLKPP
jgi:hypothetical protein